MKAILKVSFSIKIIAFFLLFLTTSSTAQWIKIQNPGSRATSYKEISEQLYIGTEDNGIFKSSNNGDSWTKIQTDLFESVFDIQAFQNRNDTIWVGSYGGGVMVTYDKGNTWHSFSQTFETQPFLVDIELLGDTLYAAITYQVGFMPSGVYKTSIHNNNWIRSNTNLPGSIFGVMDLLISSNGTMYLASALAGLRGNVNVSFDKAETWLNKAIPNVADVNVLYEAGTKIYAGTSSGIFYTTDTGETWFSLSEELNQYYVDDILVYDNYIFSAIDQVGIVVSSDEGETWDNISANLPMEDDYVSNIYIYNNYLFASLNATNGIWKHSLPLTGNDDEPLPDEFTLEQNYPNPFNPNTKIKFSIPHSQFATLKVYDILGREIKTLLSKQMQPGSYEFEFDGSDLSGGIYFYKLSVGNKNQTKKMILLK